MIRLEQSVLMRPEFLKFCLEELILLIGYRFLVQNQNIRDVIGMNLLFESTQF